MNKYILCLFFGMTLIFSGCSREISSDSLSGSAQSPPAQEETRKESGPSENAKSDEVVLSASRDIFAMDTYMTVQCYGDQCEEAADAAVLEIERLDSLLSVGNPESEIIMLNGSGSAVLSDDSAAMVEEALSIYDGTGGAFDITVYPLMALWGFIDGNPAVPDEDALHETLSKVGSDKLHYETAEKSLTLGDGQGIDLGGIAKGYTSDRLMEIFAKYQLRSAMVSLGGNVQLYQTKPDGSLWRCGIRDPFAGQDSNALLGVLSARDCAVITSGAYERCFADENGTIYHHILDPKTGYPAQSGLSSSTIVSKSGMLADALSTACYVSGLDGAIKYWQTRSGDFDMILVTDEKEVYITKPLQENFSTDYPVHVIDEGGIQ